MVGLARGPGTACCWLRHNIDDNDDDYDVDSKKHGSRREERRGRVK